uniref:Uncharacterized protein n=1 Tax=Faecalibaculum rodentium TaxID=1702221 RepID=A0A140DWJ1_9FIRM|nr:hypothetical protein AALO17_18840 [Faecalibaculum rodentium]
MFPFFALFKRSIQRCFVLFRYNVTTHGTYLETIAHKFTEQKIGMLLR